jgi:hypothetical protein
LPDVRVQIAKCERRGKMGAAVQTPTKLQLTINLKGAKSLNAPPTLLARADGSAVL